MKEKYHMFKILVPVTIVASSMACMANAETKIEVTGFTIGYTYGFWY